MLLVLSAHASKPKLPDIESSMPSGCVVISQCKPHVVMPTDVLQNSKCPFGPSTVVNYIAPSRATASRLLNAGPASLTTAAPQVLGLEVWAPRSFQGDSRNP